MFGEMLLYLKFNGLQTEMPFDFISRTNQLSGIKKKTKLLVS